MKNVGFRVTLSDTAQQDSTMCNDSGLMKKKMHVRKYIHGSG